MEAEPTLRAAIVEASRAHDDETAARAWLSLVYADTALGELARADHRLLGATAAVERVGDELLHAWLLNNRGILVAEQGDFEAARGHLERALELKSRALGGGHVDVGIAWFNLGSMLGNSKHFAAAREHLVHASEIFEATVGSSHPMSIFALGSRCTAELRLDRLADALELCRRALDRFESSSMPPSWGGRIQLTMAEVLWKLDRRDEARHELGHAASNLAPDDPGFTQAMVRWLEVGESPVEWAFKIE